MKTIQSRSPDFFLGATTPAGFKGYFEPLRREPGMQMLLIKSGPGCGKSTLMKHLAQAAEQQGQREYGHGEHGRPRRGYAEGHDGAGPDDHAERDGRAASGVPAAPTRPAAGKPQTYVKDKEDPYANVGRNDPCPCGSGKKFKKCHGQNL